MAPAKSVAQVVTAPQSSGGRGAQTLKLSFDVQGGYDDKVMPHGEAGSIADLAAGKPGYVGFGNASVAYSAGKPNASFEMSGQSFVSSYSVNRDPVVGGDISMKGNLTLGGRTQLGVSQVARSEPYAMLGAFNALPVASDKFSPDQNPGNGLAENRSLTYGTSASAGRNWSRKTSTRFEYRLDRRVFTLTPELDNRTHTASLSYDYSLSRSVGLQASYSYSNIDAVIKGGPLNLVVSQTAEAGFSYSRSLSRNRNVTLRAGGGGILSESIIDSTTLSTNRTPSAYAGLSLGFREGWQLGADYRRSVAGLNGLLAETYIADSATIHLAGSLPADMLATVSSAYSTGQGAQSGRSDSEFVTHVSTADLRFLATRQWSAHVTYTNVHYTFDRTRLDEISVLIPGLASGLNRNSVRLGLTLLLPVIGPRPGRGN
jgi:hypothetical protein